MRYHQRILNKKIPKICPITLNNPRENFARRKITHKKKKEMVEIERKEVVILDGTLGHEWKRRTFTEESMVILWYLTGRAWPTEQPGDVLHPGVAIKTRLPGLRTNLRGSTTYDVFLDSFVYFFFFEEKNLTSGYSYRGWNVPRIRILGWLDRSFVEFRDYRASFIDKGGV